MEPWSHFPERVEKNIIPEPNTGCWLWLGTRTNMGYGSITYHSIEILAHRLVYELEKGSIPAGLELDHLCRNTLCCNPDHLEPVTHRENMRRGITGKYQSTRAHCPKGHPYDVKNTYLYRGRRYCRACRVYVKRAGARTPPNRLLWN